MGRRRKRGYLNFGLKLESLLSIGALLLILTGLLTLVSFFVQAADVNSVIQEKLNNLFGNGVFFVPLLLIFTGLMLLGTFRLPFLKMRVLLGLLLFGVSFLGLNHFLVLDEVETSALAVNNGGGEIGLKINDFVVQNFSKVGAFIIFLFSLLIAGLIIFNTSLAQISRIFSRVLIFFRDKISELAPRLEKKEKSVKESHLAPEKIKPMETTSAINEVEIVPMLADGLRKSKTEIRLEEGGQKAPEEGIKIVPPPSGPVVLRTEVVKENEPVKSPAHGETVVNLPFNDEIWEYPPLSLLSDAPTKEANRGDVARNAQIIESTLGSFGVKSKVVEVNKGPAVTQYALESAQGTKIVKIKSLQNDLAMALASTTGSVRIEAPIPGKSLVGIEVPNFSPSLVSLKSVLTSAAIKNSHSKLMVALGHDVAGDPMVADIDRMPHILIAGSTGSGKSTLIHAFLATLLFRCSPSEVKLILVDTKRVELTEYNDIPHLLTPVITEPEKVLASLKWSIAEMERRYKLFQSAKVRDIGGYNELSGFQALPYIVILIDELADLMQLAPVEVEKSICRLAQLARATGIHLVLSTQRPEVRVITGLIKANIPCRISFNVVTQIDSRVIIDQVGAEKLLGRGDMLYVPPDTAKPMRIQGVYVSPVELRRLIDFLKQSKITPEYKEEVIETAAVKPEDLGQSDDNLFQEAIKVVCEYDRASASLLQRRLKIGYARAARLLDDLEVRGIIGAADGAKPREVFIHGSDSVISPAVEE